MELEGIAFLCNVISKFDCKTVRSMQLQWPGISQSPKSQPTKAEELANDAEDFHGRSRQPNIHVILDATACKPGNPL